MCLTVAVDHGHVLGVLLFFGIRVVGFERVPTLDAIYRFQRLYQIHTTTPTREAQSLLSIVNVLIIV